MDEVSGDVVAQAALDAISFLEERVDDPNLLAVSVVLVAENGDGDIRMVSHTWPPKD